MCSDSVELYIMQGAWHQDVGQMYVNYYDRYEKLEEAKTGYVKLGLLLYEKLLMLYL